MWHELLGGPAYQAGASGTVTIPAGAVIVQIVAHASSAGATVSLFGGASIPIVANAAPMVLRFNHTLWQQGQLGSTIVFTGTDSYFVETVREGHAN